MEQALLTNTLLTYFNDITKSGEYPTVFHNLSTPIAFARKEIKMAFILYYIVTV